MLESINNHILMYASKRFSFKCNFNPSKKVHEGLDLPYIPLELYG